jgi:hypothetical protein
MANDPTADEQPKRKLANRVVTSKRKYFLPDHGVSVEAATLEEAQKKVSQVAQENEDE